MQTFRKRYTGAEKPLPGLPDWESALLCARGIDTPEKAERFLRPSLEDLHDPMEMRDMDRALTLIRMAIRRKDRMLVYGDYDVDGISAVTILLETLREAGAEADFRIPARHQEGYGLNERAVREIAAEYQLLITVDCGITSVKEVRLAKELGLTVIVTDHHEVPEILPPADAAMDPLLGSYPFRRLCGAGVALKICQALLGMESVEKKLEVAALATVCDIVPLMDENRVIVREGLARMAETVRPGLRALMENARVAAPVSAEDLGFRLGPRLNAAGRLADASLGVRLLMTRDPAEAKRLADQLEDSNRERQEMEKRMLQEAETLLPEQVDLRRDRAIILAGEDWNSGVIGLVAGKLCERLHHPTVVLSRQGDQAVGSCRSIPGVNIWQMLNACGDLFLRFGGHEQAAGLTLPAEKISQFRQRLNDAIRENCPDSCFLPVREYDEEIPLEQVNLEMVEALEALEPVGCGNPSPVFLTRDASLQAARRVGKDQSHLKLSLLAGDCVRDGIGFGLGDLADQPLNQVDVLFRPSRNEFNGRVTAQLQVQAMRPAAGGGAEPDGEDPRAFFLACLQEMSLLASKKTDHPRPAGTPRPEYLLKEWFGRTDGSREAVRHFYVALRGFRGDSLEALARAAEVPEEQALFLLEALRQLELVRWQAEPFRAELLPWGEKKRLEDSPLLRYWQRLRG
ncbi:MAG: single-stranded-DNA-specific exonuclease RecJ [Clostridia bacterium]|nr:single-stranded-DNA-specific exonuclease RecJ [Clostridia bacterium]